MYDYDVHTCGSLLVLQSVFTVLRLHLRYLWEETSVGGDVKPTQIKHDGQSHIACTVRLHCVCVCVCVSALVNMTISLDINSLSDNWLG